MLFVYMNSSWRMDETYIRLNGKWIYLYRAVDKYGDTIEFLLRARRDGTAAKTFFRKAFKENGIPEKVTEPYISFRSGSL